MSIAAHLFAFVCVCVCAIVERRIYKCLCISSWKFQMNIAGRMFAFMHGCVCVCVWVGMCVCVMQYQSHSPKPFMRGNDRGRVPDPNWASGTLHTPPVIRCVCLMQYQASTTLLLIQKCPERLSYTVRPVLHDKNARARRTVPPPKWPPRTDNKSPRDSPHLVRLGQSIELSMAFKVASSSPPTLWSHLLSQFNLVCVQWS